MRHRRIGTLSAAAALLLSALALASGARADGDPASDVLYTQSVFLPYSTKVSPALAQELEQATAAARTIRVALIAAPTDLGAIPSLFGKPAAYARFLGMELQFVYPGRLLVVMPQGAALSRRGRLVPNAAVGHARVRPGGDGLAETALALVGELTGRPLPRNAPRPQPRPVPVQAPAGTSVPSVTSRPATTTAEGVPLWEAAAIAAGAVCLVVAAGLALARRRARRLGPVEPPVWKPPDPADPYRYVDPF